MFELNRNRFTPFAAAAGRLLFFVCFGRLLLGLTAIVDERYINMFVIKRRWLLVVHALRVGERIGMWMIGGHTRLLLGGRRLVIVGCSWWSTGVHERTVWAVEKKVVVRRLKVKLKKSKIDNGLGH